MIFPKVYTISPKTKSHTLQSCLYTHILLFNNNCSSNIHLYMGRPTCRSIQNSRSFKAHLSLAPTSPSSPPVVPNTAIVWIMSSQQLRLLIIAAFAWLSATQQRAEVTRVRCHFPVSISGECSVVPHTPDGNFEWPKSIIKFSIQASAQEVHVFRVYQDPYEFKIVPSI